MVAKKKYLILVHSSIINAPEAQALTVAGHDVKIFLEATPEDFEAADLILGPNCWRTTEFLTKFIKEAVTSVGNTKKRRAKKE